MNDRAEVNGEFAPSDNRWTLDQQRLAGAMTSPIDGDGLRYILATDGVRTWLYDGVTWEELPHDAR